MSVGESDLAAEQPVISLNEDSFVKTSIGKLSLFIDNENFYCNKVKRCTRMDKNSYLICSQIIESEKNFMVLI